MTLRALLVDVVVLHLAIGCQAAQDAEPMVGTTSAAPSGAGGVGGGGGSGNASGAGAAGGERAAGGANVGGHAGGGGAPVGSGGGDGGAGADGSSSSAAGGGIGGPSAGAGPVGGGPPGSGSGGGGAPSSGPGGGGPPAAGAVTSSTGSGSSQGNCFDAAAGPIVNGGSACPAFGAQYFLECTDGVVTAVQCPSGTGCNQLGNDAACACILVPDGSCDPVACPDDPDCP